MSWTDKINEMKGNLRNLNPAIPEVSAGFGALSKAAKSGKALDTKTIELIALGIAVADRCEPCIAFHTDALVKLGASRDEITDALGICIQMGGGPSLMYASKALACYDEFVAAKG